MSWMIRARFGTTGASRPTLTADSEPTGLPKALPALVSVRIPEQLAGEVWPPARERPAASLSILAATATEAAELVGLGTDVVIDYISPSPLGDIEWTYAGRTAEPVITPVDEGVLVEVTVTDYRVDLDEYTVGEVDYPAEDARARLDRMFIEAGVTPLDVYVGETWPMLAAREAAPVTLLAETEAILSYALMRRIPDWLRWDLRPRLHPDGGLLDPPFNLGVAGIPAVPVSQSPLILVDGEVAWDLDDPDTRPYLIDANTVDFGAAKWSRRRSDRVNTVEVVLADKSMVRTSSRLPGQPRITYTIETTLTEPAAAERLAEYLLPGIVAGDTDAWQADQFTIYQDLNPDGWTPVPLRGAMVVVGIPPGHNPDGTAFHVGAVALRELEAKEDTVTFKTQLRPVAGMTTTTDAITIDELPGTIDSIHATLNDLAQVRA